jgi:dihydrodipicolinate synthase/N-acetylneuraminate lyase
MPRLPTVNRRTLLKQLAAGATVSACTFAFPSISVGSKSRKGATTPDDFKAQLRGAVLSIPTPFKKSLAVDLEGVSRMIERAQPHGIRVFSLTSGNGQYSSLTHDEIFELTRVMVESVDGKGLTIAAADRWDVPTTIEYANFAASIGANGLQVVRPDTKDDDEVVDYFQSIAAKTDLPLVLHGEFSHPLLDKILAIDSVVAMKEDVGLEYYIQLQRKYGERLRIFEGGPEYAFLVAYPYGARASYTTLGTFVPQITQRFWEAVNRNDLKAAYDIVIKYEHPFFDRWSHAFWRASLEHFGVAQRYLRPPQESFTNDQMRGVADFYRSLGLS